MNQDPNKVDIYGCSVCLLSFFKSMDSPVAELLNARFIDFSSKKKKKKDKKFGWGCGETEFLYTVGGFVKWCN